MALDWRASRPAEAAEGEVDEETSEEDAGVVAVGMGRGTGGN